ncbi:MAG TPA: sugar phosphate isomerase/epimerase family protein [Planctomicrobium sp.]|nr:sugar phosphate isomerase/epimerase family protein [Planctomicrobium sp.]
MNSPSETSPMLTPSTSGKSIPGLSATSGKAPGKEISLPASPLTERMAINQLTTLRNCLATDLTEYQRFGIPAIGLSWRKIQKYGIRRSLRKVQQSGVPVSSVGWIGGFTGEHGHSLCELIADARRVIRFAGQVRAGTVTVITGPQAGHIRSHAFRITAEALTELSDLAATYDVVLAVQPMHALFSRNWSFLNTIDDTLQLMDRVNHPQLQMAFGTYHLWSEPNLMQRLEEIASRIRLVSLADWGPAPRHENDRLLPGNGHLPLTDLILALENNGFFGWYEMDVWSRDLWNLDHRDLMQRCVSARDQLSASLQSQERSEKLDDVHYVT